MTAHVPCQLCGEHMTLDTGSQYRCPNRNQCGGEELSRLFRYRSIFWLSDDRAYISAYRFPCLINGTGYTISGNTDHTYQTVLMGRWPRPSTFCKTFSTEAMATIPFVPFRMDIDFQPQFDALVVTLQKTVLLS